VVVPGALRRELEALADAEAPNEACGYVAVRDGVAERLVAAENAAASPYRFDMRAKDPGLVIELEDQGYELAIFHSHPTDKAEPSRTDIANIGLYEGKPYLILSRPTRELRAWRIADGRAEELAID
jgi:[CysO sulfur-carrier protein]-S-L-cysteine hydrolase